MPQRCGLCGKTEKQHKGKACVDPQLQRLIELTKALQKAKDVKDAH